MHVRQLRLKLHEYFDSEGRKEKCIVEIPKGATTQFRNVEQKAAEFLPTTSASPAPFDRPLIPWALAGLFLCTTVLMYSRPPAPAEAGCGCLAPEFAL